MCAVLIAVVLVLHQTAVLCEWINKSLIVCLYIQKVSSLWVLTQPFYSISVDCRRFVQTVTGKQAKSRRSVWAGKNYFAIEWSLLGSGWNELLKRVLKIRSIFLVGSRVLLLMILGDQSWAWWHTPCSAYHCVFRTQYYEFSSVLREMETHFQLESITSLPCKLCSYFVLFCRSVLW